MLVGFFVLTSNSENVMEHSPTPHPRAAVLTDRFFVDEDDKEKWDSPGERERVIERISEILRRGFSEHLIINAAKSVRDYSRPVSMFMEVTSTPGRLQASALAGSQIYPAPGVAPPRSEVKEEERSESFPTMCRVHMIKLHARVDEEVARRCSACEMGG
ncbi:hypothetical protein [Nocardiopsis sp. L17-MgMaSL7]|uniref:hypothetical protein n=1 Tax=Nocardiopsis sp. L17-MgMaSL7 TaxID=1938893 RepID=UPI000D71603E|nr:hypothetical protein [Nocardiopsis sp. L17-MgMaSL7]PWV44613.1 hypothetical protein BDW27_12372 [Nocardiopsis sp. L17-MgMaSL7]